MAYFSCTPTDTNRLPSQADTQNTHTNENTSKDTTDRQHVAPHNTNTNHDTSKNTEID